MSRLTALYPVQGMVVMNHIIVVVLYSICIAVLV